MALSEGQIKEIGLLVKLGELSNVKIGEKVGCSESAVRTSIRKNGFKKNEINEVAKAEVSYTILAKEIEKKKNEFNEDEKRAYVLAVDTIQKTHKIAENFQDQIKQRQEFDSMAIEALIELKAKNLSEAETPEDILLVNLKYREYMSDIANYKDIKDGVEANDKAMITKGEAPRFAPKSDTNTNTVVIVDSKEGKKARF